MRRTIQTSLTKHRRGWRETVLRTGCVACATLLLALPPTAAEQPATTAAGNTTAIIEPRFPRETSTPAGKLVVHAPQIGAWPDYETIDAQAAVEVTLKDRKPEVGTVRFTAATSADVAARTVTFYKIQITDVRFAGKSEKDRRALETFVRDTAQQAPLKMPLDVVLRYLADSALPVHNPNLAMKPPEIHYSAQPAILVLTDGAPLKIPVKDTKLSWIANTNWDLFFHSKEARWYLLNGKQWLRTAKDGSLAEKWQLAEKLPKDFKKLPETANFVDTRANVPPQVTAASIPQVFAATRPAELIVTDGAPDLAPIDGTGLSWVTDTGGDLFQLGNTWYFLVSGRWFAASALAGPWSTVTQLPPDFAKIPTDHPRARVRTSVPGTEEAKLAALEADIPRKAQLKRTATPGITVNYTGEPQFEQITTLPVFRASNSPYDVLRVGTTYYLCYNAAWWVGTSPTGAWAPATKVPPEIYKIPPASPSYHVTQVKIYGADEQTVTTGYTAGYSGVYTTSTTVVYGTGYYYPPYVYYGAYYPVYYPYPTSYGRASWYNPATGNFGAAEAIYGPYGGAGRAAVYNPESGTYGRGRAVWDSDEMAMQGGAYNPRTGGGFYTERYRNEDGAWGQSLTTRNDNWVYRQSEFSGNTGTVDFATSGGAQGTTNLTRDGDTVSSDTTVNRGDKSMSSEGSWTSDGGGGSFETSGGASGDFNREFNNGTVTGSSETTKGDKSMSSEMVRTDEGSARQVTGSGGEQAAVAYDRDSGDLYAGKDGEVYKRTEDGWQQQSGNSQRSAGQTGTTSATGAARNSGQYQQLERDHRARQDGYNSFNQRSGGGGSRQPRGGGGGGRRR